MARMDGDGVERRAVPRPRRLWEKVRENVRHLQRRMEQEWQRLRVNQSLGRPVSRRVLSPDRRVIVDRGERVTPSMVAHARESGVLEVLLDAVDDGAEVDRSV